MAMTHVDIAPAIMADEWDDLCASINEIHTYAPCVDIDVMDGHLVPSFSFPYNKTTLGGEALPHKDSMVFTAHLMVQHPREVGERFIEAGVTHVVAQIEGFRQEEAPSVLASWRERGARTGVSVLLETPLEHVYPLIEGEHVDSVQCMSIARVGFQGEPFVDAVYARIEEIRSRYPDISIAVDGGVSMHNALRLVEAGATKLSVGSEIVQQRDPAKAYSQLYALVNT